MKLGDLNTKPDEQFLELIGGPLEGEVWLAKRIIAHRPFTTVDDLVNAFETVIGQTSEDEKGHTNCVSS